MPESSVTYSGVRHPLRTRPTCGRPCHRLAPVRRRVDTPATTGLTGRIDPALSGSGVAVALSRIIGAGNTRLRWSDAGPRIRGGGVVRPSHCRRRDAWQSWAAGWKPGTAISSGCRLEALTTEQVAAVVGCRVGGRSHPSGSAGAARVDASRHRASMQHIETRGVHQTCTGWAGRCSPRYGGNLMTKNTDNLDSLVEALKPVDDERLASLSHKQAAQALYEEVTLTSSSTAPPETRRRGGRRLIWQGSVSPARRS
jgi:hypothetical protein